MEWCRLADLLERLRVLTPGDGPILDRYADAWDRARTARDAVGKHGLVIETDLGGVKKNPAADIESQARAQMIRCLIEMGLTPASRSRVASVAEPEKDALDEFLRSQIRARDEPHALDPQPVG